MAEIIKKEIIKINNGDLKRMCIRKNVSIPTVAAFVSVSDDLLYRFDRGERTISLDLWEKICELMKK